MNCHSVRKFLYAFADNQLSIKANCEVLDHLKMCPACSRIVDEHQSLRGALGRDLAAVSAPAELRGRIVAASRASAASGASGRKLRWRFVAPAAAAAGLVIAFAGIWGRGLLPGASQPEQVPVVVASGQVAASIVASLHNENCKPGDSRPHPALPRNLADAAPVLSARFGGRLAVLAPNLSAYGFEFESAGFCGLRDRNVSEGCQVVYASSDRQVRMSLLSVPRWDRLDQVASAGAIKGDAFREFRIDEPNGPNLSVLAWHIDATTYVMCCEMELPQLRQIGEAVRAGQLRHGTYGVH